MGNFVFIRRPVVSINKEVGDRIRNFDNLRLGLGNNWSVSLWVKSGSGLPAGGVSRNAFMAAAFGGTLPNKIQIVGALNFFGIKGAGLFLWNSGGILFKQYLLPDVFPQGVWAHVVVTWDGTSLNTYSNGNLSSFLPIVNNAGSQTDALRSVGIGNSSLTTSLDNDSLPGVYHSCATWDVALTASEVTEIYNQGNPGCFDLKLNRGNYNRAGNLRHLWKFGSDLNSIGKDWADRADTVNVVSTDAVGIVTSDVWYDFPGRS